MKKIYRYYVEDETVKLEIIECKFDGTYYFDFESDENIVHENYVDSHLYYTEYYDSGIRDGYFYFNEVDHSDIIDLYIIKNDAERVELYNNYQSRSEKLYLDHIKLGKIKRLNDASKIK